ncbi:bifunctional indole-3-glycerol-phosphate synthase TrpC/phosphoribosylanthranilate isomerase TrpF [Catenovulum sp. SM1970]|uniref:bifunctional indole-3-glycerol-phosphate synthase TrpC/phosphoribosylanthranilate isomerase TrpF n=1 Tax=Marinifaba aquimaris TaxID=2741323 RepID=UPI001573E319|nr:bifunctional indole-3-glycerol-phosphate synthase TrpC/phosphoribosylanthranilate isomerase TrpF [Marinifaba aquimaris]NTS76124.1 bifunctional indole-3-glycerol-phosphate synthase TrpC/phosphoribosylanthranilate isomerase TrpF [Marinifaba aquimaris]
MANVLERICDDKRAEIESLEASLPVETFIGDLTKSDRSLYEALAKPEAGFILECKKASPSKGLIREQFDLDEIVTAYAPFASGISVLTESKYFQGNYAYVGYVRERVSQPVLNKDFFVKPYQVHLARYHGADAILLMLSVLTDDEYREMADIAAKYDLDILTEVSNEEETQRAIDLNAQIIGINNRNLRDLSTDLQTTRDLAKLIPKGRLVISESGIYTHDQVVELHQYADGYLVGSSLMAQQDLNTAVKKLVLGENKVCGLTRAEDAKAVFAAGAVYGGLIFADKSPRCVNIDQAAQIKAAAPLDYVGVFVDAPEYEVVETARSLGLKVVQLHGSEDQTYIDRVRRDLDEGIEIWKAHNIAKSALPKLNNIDKWLLDSSTKDKAGGTGHTFDWSLIQDTQFDIPFMLAGGLTPANIREANKLGAVGLDLNSGVEAQPGVKDSEKINQAFEQIRLY